VVWDRHKKRYLLVSSLVSLLLKLPINQSMNESITNMNGLMTTGVALLCIPHHSDQFAVSSHVEALGAGLTYLAPGNLTTLVTWLIIPSIIIS
jgi:hypothetical protein